MADCEGGVDEDTHQWVRCDQSEVYTEHGVDCLDYYYCGPSKDDKIPFAYLCDRINSCSNEAEVCRISRDQVDVQSTVLELRGTVYLSYCVPGLQLHGRGCVEDLFVHQDTIFGAHPFKIVRPRDPIDCSALFGEGYVYATCLGICQDTSLTCPLTPTPHQSTCPCADQFKSKVFTVATPRDHRDPYLTFLIPGVEGGDVTYNIPRIFTCSDGSCIGFDQVCVGRFLRNMEIFTPIFPRCVT